MQCHLRGLGRTGLVASLLLAPFGCGGGSGRPSLIEAAACTGTFNACGGDPTGTWDVVGMCLEGDLAAALNAEMAVDYPACGNTYSAASAALGGSVTYGSGKYSFDADMLITQSFAYTPACVSEITGGVALSASVCTQLQQGLNDQAGGKATCSYVAPNCNCQGTLSHTNTTAGTYTVSGSTITESSGTSYEFCVAGSAMTQRENVSGNAYGVTQLKKR